MNDPIRSRIISFFLMLSTVLATAPLIMPSLAWAVKPKSAKAPAASAAPVAAEALGLQPEVISAKAFLEELLARRYAQELATRVENADFKLGAQLSLVNAPKNTQTGDQKAEPKQDDSILPGDLTLGTLDPEELIKRYADPVAQERLQGYLSNYRVQAVAVSVGLRDGFKPELKAEIEKWLNERVAREFGAVGKGSVSLITQKKGYLELLRQYQGLAGELVIAVAILLGTVLCGLLFGRNSSKQAPNITIENRTEAPAAPQPQVPDAAQEALERANREKELELERARLEEARLAEEVQQVTRKLIDLAPRVSKDADFLVRSWCLEGSEGQLKLACFAEAAGKELGKLSIPVDASQSVSKIFSKMPSLALREKRDALTKAYWDILSAINLGNDILEKPFGYLASLNSTLVSQILMKQNSKMKTLVALHMPTQLRASYMDSLEMDAKLQVLQQASQLNDIDVEELRSADTDFRTRMDRGRQSSRVMLESAFSRVAETLNPREEITLLKNLTGEAIDRYKRTTPSLAFLSEWPDDKLSTLMSRVQPDELLTFLRFRPELQEHFLSLCPPMTSEVVSDELQREENRSEAEIDRVLTSFKAHIQTMVSQNEISLERLFSASAKAPQGSQQDNSDAKAA